MKWRRSAAIGLWALAALIVWFGIELCLSPSQDTYQAMRREAVCVAGTPTPDLAYMPFIAILIGAACAYVGLRR